MRNTRIAEVLIGLDDDENNLSPDLAFLFAVTHPQIASDCVRKTNRQVRGMLQDLTIEEVIHVAENMLDSFPYRERLTSAIMNTKHEYELSVY